MSRNARFFRSFLYRHLLLAVAGLCPLLCCAQVAAPAPAEGPPSPRVISVHHPHATDAFHPNPTITREMLECALTNLTSVGSVPHAWRSLLSTQDVVGLKVFSVAGPNSGTRPTVVAAVIQGLLAAGIPPAQIIVWDRQTSDLRAAGFFQLATQYKVRVMGADQAGYDEKAFYERPLIGNLVWGDYEFGKEGSGVGRKSFVTKLVTQEMTKIITISPVLNHNLTGVAGHLYSLSLGSVDNILRFENDLPALVLAIPEIYALEQVGDKVILSITDALVCQYEGSERSLLHYAEAMNQIWLSHDPVALDILAMRELDQRRSTNSSPRLKMRMDLYRNAELLDLGTSNLKSIKVEFKPLHR